MRILFAISIVALIALLWAAFSIARHIRRTRRRRRRALGELPMDPAARATFGDRETPAPAHGLKFQELTPYNDAVVTPVEWTSASADAPTVPEDTTFAVDNAGMAMDAAVPLLIDDAEAPVATVVDEETTPEYTEPLYVSPEPPLVAEKLPAAEDVPTAVEQQVEQEEAHTVTTLAAAQALENEHDTPTPEFDVATEQVPVLAEAEVTTGTDDPATAAASTPASPAFPVPPRTAPVHPLSRLARRTFTRPDWAYFNKDMGDLTDPEVARAKPKDRPAG